jgi:hypothetical protein
MGAFFGLFFLQIVSFSAVGVLIFGEISEYNNLTSATIMIFQTSMGMWDLTMYDVLEEKRRYVGILFHVLLICVNLLLLLNLLIALMQDTYGEMSGIKMSLYYKNIIYAMPHYKYDPTYACLIAICPPFNVLVLIFVPFFVLSKD